MNCSPELGAAAMAVVKLGAKSYREGKVFHFDRQSMTFSDGSPSWANGWEAFSAAGGPTHHVPGWSAGDTGSKLVPKDYQQLAGPWLNGADPAANG